MLSSIAPQKKASIDLHGLSVADAKATVIARIKEFSNTGCYDIRIITGRGAHSNHSGERAILFKSLPSWLDDLEVKMLIKDVKENEGSYIVKLHEQPSLIQDNNKAPISLLFDEMIKQIGIPKIKELAKTDPTYQGLLGFLSLTGEDTDLSTSQATQQLRNAADRGDEMSKLLLAQLHTDGTPGVAKQSPDKVVKYLEEVASFEGPHAAEAQFRLGIAYLLGRGAKQNDARAIKCFTDAAKKNHPLAQLNLAKIYDEGKITPKDDKLATFYYHAAAKQRNLEALKTMADRFLHGIGTAPSEKSAFQCRKIAAKDGDVESLFYIGEAYESGKGVERNIDLAYESFSDAAEKGHMDARVRAAFILLQGSEFCDRALGFIWLKEAVEHENPEALYIMARLHNSGNLQPIVLKNEALALELIGKSARLGYAPAQKLIFQEDLDVGIGRKTVNEWMVELALKGDKEAEAYYIYVLESLGEHNQVQQFKKMILDSQKSMGHGQVVSSPKSTVSPSAASSRTVTPQYSSSQRLGRTQNSSATQDVNSVASSVASLSISAPSVQVPANSENSQPNKSKGRKKRG